MNHLQIPVGSRDHIEGRPDAPLTLVEYGDFECPYCGRMYPIVKALQRALGERLRVAFRNFPLVEMHPHAGQAALMAEAAGAAGLYWPMHDMLYEHQGALSDVDLIRYAQRLGMTQAQIDSAFDGSHASRVREDFSGGVRSGVNGTPTLFINGLRYDGPPDYGALLETLKLQLRAA